MTVNVQDHRSMLLQTDDEFRDWPPGTRNSSSVSQTFP